MGKPTKLSTVLLSQWTRLPPPLHADLTSKTVLVLGANTGIGLEAAIHFAEMKPARLIVACRSHEKGLRALEDIAKRTSYVAELQLVDLSKFASVQEFVTRIGDDPIDYLVANAAVAGYGYETTSDGWEVQLQVNHLSTALVSILLLPNMMRASEEHKSNSRLVVVSSGMHAEARIDKVASAPNVLSALSDKEYCAASETMAHRYNDTKLLNVFFARAFAEHLRPRAPVIASAVCPGYCRSELRRNLPLGTLIMMRAMDILLGRTAEEGSRQLVWAALGPDGKDGDHVRHLQGAYVSTLEVIEPADYVINQEGHNLQEKLWNETIEILSQVDPRVKEVVETYL